MSGFALPKLRWLVLGALAAGAWAMTQEVPSKAPANKSSTQAANRTRTDTSARRDATAARPKPRATANAEPSIVRPKADVAQRPVRPAPQKLAAAPRPQGEPLKKKPVDVQRPKAAVAQTPKASASTRPSAELKTASISKAPKPAPRPETMAAAAPKANTPKAAPAPSLNVLYTSTTSYLRKRPEMAAPVLHKLKQGESVRVFARDGKWTLVSASGRKGWLHDDVLRPADPAAPRPKEALADPARSANPG